MLSVDLDIGDVVLEDGGDVDLFACTVSMVGLWCVGGGG